MLRQVLIGMLTTALLGAVAASAPAQRDAGAKARGEYGTGFWGQRPAARRYYAGPSFYVPAPTVDNYRSFSYEPIAIAPGDEVTVSVKEAKMMRGRTLVGTLAEGQKFNVTRIENGWLGTVVEVNVPR